MSAGLACVEQESDHIFVYWTTKSGWPSFSVHIICKEVHHEMKELSTSYLY
jgi:hypothetical protein